MSSSEVSVSVAAESTSNTAPPSNGSSPSPSSTATANSSTMNSVMQIFPAIVELNVGGVFYTTALSTLTRETDSVLGQMFSGRSRTPILRDSKGKFFLDRDGVLFRYILDFLRNQKLVLPENFHERERLKQEASFFKLTDMVTALEQYHPSSVVHHSTQPHSTSSSHVVPAAGLEIERPLSLEDSSPTQSRTAGYITIGYRGTFAFGRDGLADVKFRKLSRILVCGRVALCREVFGETLNESRDPDRGASDRYSSRFFLKHTFLEQAFDMLQEAGFSCEAACASGTASAGTDMKPGMDSEENRWNHYNEFIFVRN